MIGKYSEIGDKAGQRLAEKLAAEEAQPAKSPEESAWRRFNDPARRRRMLDEARKAALAAGRCKL